MAGEGAVQVRANKPLRAGYEYKFGCIVCQIEESAPE